jgi:hypothetical protein
MLNSVSVTSELQQHIATVNVHTELFLEQPSHVPLNNGNHIITLQRFLYARQTWNLLTCCTVDSQFCWYCSIQKHYIILSPTSSKGGGWATVTVLIEKNMPSHADDKMFICLIFLQLLSV